MIRLDFHARRSAIRAAALLVSLTALPVTGLAQQPAPDQPGVEAAADSDRMTLNFSDTDINAVINAVAEITGKNFIVDPRVKGQVTVISTQPLGRDALYEVFLSLLKVHGFAAIPGQNAVKIVPDVHAKQDAVPTVSGRLDGGDEFVTQVFAIQHVDAAQLVPILRPLVPQRGHLAAYPPSNVLVISDSAGNVDRIGQIIERIDTAVQQEVEVIRLEHASAAEVVRILTQLQPQENQQGGQSTLVADERTNSVLLGGDTTVRLRMRALISHLDTSIETGGATQVVYLRYANAKELVPVLTGVSESLTEEQAQGGGNGGQQARAVASERENVVIQADENTNALVITAPPDLFRSLRSVIRQLDVRRAQVLVEAVIAEVSAEKAMELGVQWFVDGRDGDNAIGVVNFSTGDPITGLLSDPPRIGDGLNLGLGNFGDSMNWGAFIRALASDGSTNVLSTPSLVTMDNEEAEIVVGQNVPFVTGVYSTTGGGGAVPQNPFQTIQRQDVGVTLRLRPQINEGDAIRLEIVQETSSVGESAQAVDIVTNKRSIKTNVMVDDGQVLVLGGLIEDRLRAQQQQVPLLGDIPVLGWLFKYQNNVTEKTNLMVFIRPVILKDAALQARHTGEKYSYIRAQQMARREQEGLLAPGEGAPLLPEMEQFMRLPPAYDQSVPEPDARDFPPEVTGDDNSTPRS